jgi:hypothetical protein
MTAGYTRILPAALLALAAAPVPALADDVPEGLSASGSIRLRYEAIGGQARAGFNDHDELTNLRTQLKLTWKHERVRLVAEVYDSRAWGADPGTPLSTNEVNAFEPVQAYVQADLGGVLGTGTKTSVQAGRFTLELGSRRLVAADDYRNTVSGFTGVRADTATASGIKATAIYVLPQLRLPDDGPSLRDNDVKLDREGFASVLWGGFLARQAKGSPVLAEVSYLHFGERDRTGRPTRDRSLNSVGARVLSDPRPGRFDAGAEAIYQWGEISASAAANATRVPVSASFMRLHAGYSFAGKWKPRVLAELDRASGDGRGRTYGRFDPLFGMRRADLGPAGLYNAVGRSNVLSPGVRVEVTPSKRVDAFVGYRALWLADRHDAFSTTGVSDASGRSGRFAGHQLDTRLRYWLVPVHLRAEIDATYLARGTFLHRAPGGSDHDVRYASFNLTGYF